MVSKSLHWLAIIIILVQFITGLLRYFKIVSAGSRAGAYTYWHMPAGITVLGPLLVRLLYRAHNGAARLD